MTKIICNMFFFLFFFTIKAEETLRSVYFLFLSFINIVFFSKAVICHGSPTCTNGLLFTIIVIIICINIIIIIIIVVVVVSVVIISIVIHWKLKMIRQRGRIDIGKHVQENRCSCPWTFLTESHQIDHWLLNNPHDPMLLHVSKNITYNHNIITFWTSQYLSKKEKYFQKLLVYKMSPVDNNTIVSVKNVLTILISF